MACATLDLECRQATPSTLTRPSAAGCSRSVRHRHVLLPSLHGTQCARHFALVVLNAERASYSAPSFAPKIQRTRKTVRSIAPVFVHSLVQLLTNCTAIGHRTAVGWHRRHLPQQETRLSLVAAWYQVSCRCSLSLSHSKLYIRVSSVCPFVPFQYILDP